MPHHQLQNSLSELQSPPWFRSANLGFGCFADSGSSFGYCEFSLELMERDSRIALGFGVSISSWVQSGSGVSVLMRVASSLNFIGSWILIKPDAVPSAFWGMIQTSKIKG